MVIDCLLYKWGHFFLVLKKVNIFFLIFFNKSTVDHCFKKYKIYFT
jgi:hypothetical protein